MRRHSIIAAFALSVALGHEAGADTLHVNGACGNDAWSGSSPVCNAPEGPKATIQAAVEAAAPGDEVVVADGVYTGPGNRNVGLGGKAIVVRSSGGAQACVIDCQGAGRAFVLNSGETLASVIEGFTITGGSGAAGGGIRLLFSSATIRDCVFTDNTAEVGGAIHAVDCLSIHLTRCAFAGNTATVGGGAIVCGSGVFMVRDCTFTDNDGASGPGGVGSGQVNVSDTGFVNCVFRSNLATFVAGGLADSSLLTRVVNCTFSDNVAANGGGYIAAGPSVAVNCTFAGNETSGVDAADGEELALVNCVVWGNAPVQITRPAIAATFTDVQGGWPGTGNIDADPLFVQPGTGDLRLAVGSPCANAGDTSALPPDELDVDGDGNTSEPLPLDLAGIPRVIDGVVDLGAYEGEFTAGAPASSENDLDEGEFVALVPEGGPLDPVATTGVLLTNVSGGDNATATATQIDGLIHPGAGGYGEMGSVLVLETSLGAGSFKATVFVPFDAGMLGGALPREVRATWYDPSAGTWALAAWGNANPSPGFAGPIGNRLYVEAPAPWGVTQDVGDHGVYWDPASGKGFAWANVDHASDFGVGIAPCPADCVQPPDGKVNIVDMLVLLNDWGLSAGITCDVDSDGSIGASDFAALLETWGPCAEPLDASPPAPAARAVLAGSADADASGAVDAHDLELVKSCWGSSEPGCAADLDGDGTVGMRDYLHVLVHWDPADAAP